MGTPVFQHTISLLRDQIASERVPLHSISSLIKYDPSLYYAVLSSLNLSGRLAEISTLTQAISMIGTDTLERTILEQDHFLDSEFLLFWDYIVLIGEIAVLVNDKARIADDEEVFFASVLPSLGMSFLLNRQPSYHKVLKYLLRIPMEDRIYIEQKLYGSDHLEELRLHVVAPKLYRDVVALMGVMFGPDGRRREQLGSAGRLSVGYKTLQLFQLCEIAEAGAQSLLFPLVVEAREQFQELVKRHFKIAESESEEILAVAVENFEALCREFAVEEGALSYLEEAEAYRFPTYLFATNSKPFDRELQAAYAASAAGQSVLIYGEPSVGKRLLAAALHSHPDNPRKTMPMLSIHCGTMDPETLELELFGAKGGFLGLDKRRGLLDLAQGGTILLKDIDRIPLHQQEKLAATFQSGSFFPIGGTQQVSFSVKFIVTARTNILESGADGTFSPALAAVLALHPICIPPLRERREDIPFIAESIIEKYSLGLHDESDLLALYDYFNTQDFPENLRDLKRILFFLGAKRRAYA